ncbi:MAG: uroporphyrinogen-III synthase [Balneolaceae bacterium]
MNELSNLPKVLFTTELSAKQQKLLDSTTFTVTSIPFISFSIIDAKQWQHQVPENYDSWIFTSKRAVEAVKPAINSLLLPDHIFAVGGKTAQKLEELSLSPEVPKEYNLKALAKRMRDFKIENIVQFCGNLRAGDLSEYLEDNMEVTSIEVYRTTFQPQKIEVSEFDSFVFMSPSAVESFHQKNTLNVVSTIFCIGPTTANALEHFGIMNYVMPEKSTLNSLAESIHKFYSNVIS